MGLFSRKSRNKTPEQGTAAPSVDVQAELDAVKERLAASEQARAELDARLEARLGALDQGVALMGDQVTALVVVDRSASTRN